ncbi:MAG: L,D-transpeptidase family protein [Proteobacteria bacterium]|nr:L,D-transpeptidase family protein [Pseudomonadota bacterium]
MDLILTAPECLTVGGQNYRCASGHGGITDEKREGDGATPTGRHPLRAVYYRADKLRKPQTDLPVSALAPNDGWCDDPADANYNRKIALPYPARHEMLWREDSVYDVIVELGYNDAPVVPELGSAIFLHVATSDFRATEGCIAVALPDLLAILQRCDKRSALVVTL